MEVENLKDPLVLSAGALGLLAFAILVGFLVHQARKRHIRHVEREAAVPIVVFAPRAGTPNATAGLPPRPFSGPSAERPFGPPGFDRTPAPAPAVDYAHAPNGNGDNGWNGGGAYATPHPDLVEGKTVRFYRPPEGTLQMLPGRLEIVEGEDRGQAIRFIKMRSGPQQITFGRREGSPYEHVQLRALTVSRQHARLDFDHGQWSIANLSETNPVIVNGETLAVAEGTRPLSDGDKIEMGEVVFRFKER